MAKKQRRYTCFLMTAHSAKVSIFNQKIAMELVMNVVNIPVIMMNIGNANAYYNTVSNRCIPTTCLSYFILKQPFVRHCQGEVQGDPD